MAKRIKTGGRQAGTPNKLTASIKQRLNQILQQELNKMPELLTRLEPRTRLELLTKLLPFVLPKLESVEPVHPDRIVIKKTILNKPTTEQNQSAERSGQGGQS